MTYIMKAAGILCLCGYVTGIISDFIPLNRTEKSVRLLVVLYIISVAFSENIQPVSIEFPSTDNLGVIKQQADDYIIQRAAENMENTIRTRLSDKNISYTDVKVHINKYTDKLFTEKIYIYGADEESLQKAKEELSDILPQESIISGEKYAGE